MPEGRRQAAVYPPLVLAAALGPLHAATFAPWGTWWAQLAVLAAVAALLLAMIRDRRSHRLVALAGLLFGFGWFLAGVGWLFVSMHTYGLMPAPLALLALVLFALYLALFPAAAAWAISTLTADRRQYGAAAYPTTRFALAFAAALTLADVGRGYVFTGFPWLAVGYGQVEGPLAGYAAVAGSYGVGFALCLAAGLVAGLISRLAGRDPGSTPHLPTRSPTPPARLPVLSPTLSPTLSPVLSPTLSPTLSPMLSAMILLALFLAGHLASGIAWSEPAGAPLKVRLLQGNVPQQMKFDPQVARQTMQRYLELVESEPADLIVLPETAWTTPWASTPPAIVERLERFVRASGSAVAIGMPLVTVAGRDNSSSTAAGDHRPLPGQSLTLTNSVLLFDRAAFTAGTGPARYDKRHLVPFGEFVPWGFRWFVDLMTIPLGDFGRGSDDQPPFVVGQQRISFNICYEDVFGEELLPMLAGANGATILANVSNIAWFGDSHALPQHLQIARMRTLETARPMIRATNTGVTAAIDFDGRVLAALPPYQLGALSVAVQGRSGLTPYARNGNWPVTVLSLLILLAAAALPAPAVAMRDKPAKILR